jgi:membrane protein implicated in regulation of membrane protease activity
LAIKIFYFFIFYFILSVVIYWVSGFTLNIYFENIAFLTASIMTIIFSYYLFKAIKNGKVEYELKSIEAYVGFIGGRIRIINEYPLPIFYHPNLLIHQKPRKVF